MQTPFHKAHQFNSQAYSLSSTSCLIASHRGTGKSQSQSSCESAIANSTRQLLSRCWMERETIHPLGSPAFQGLASLCFCCISFTDSSQTSAIQTSLLLSNSSKASNCSLKAHLTLQNSHVIANIETISSPKSSFCCATLLEASIPWSGQPRARRRARARQWHMSKPVSLNAVP